MRTHDRIRVQHMLDAAREAVGFCRGAQRIDLDSNRLLVLGVIKAVEILGEAAARISDETVTAYPQVPWRDIVGMRNRLVHVYFDVDLDVVWETVTQDLPPLISALEQILTGA